MAASALTVLSITPETASTFSTDAGDTSNGNYFDNTAGDVMLYIKNTHGSSSITVTAVVQNASKDVEAWGTFTKSSIAVSVAAGVEKILGPFPTGPFNDTNNRVQLTYSGSGTPVVKAFKSSGLRKV